MIRSTMLATVFAFGAAFGAPAFAQDIPATPEEGTFKMGILPWLGYGQWWVADKKELFAAQGAPEPGKVGFLGV